jgi:hypothetical protein
VSNFIFMDFFTTAVLVLIRIYSINTRIIIFDKW